MRKSLFLPASLWCVLMIALFSSCSDGGSVSISGPRLVESVTLSETAISLAVGDTRQLSATVEPQDAENKALSWTSTTPGFAAVSDTGLVTAVTEGTTVVSATTRDGSNKVASCTVTVTPPPVKITSITISSESGTLSLERGSTLQLSVTVEPEDAADKTVTWSSGNQVVATVDSTGLVRGIVASATAVTITATANDGSGVSGTVEVTVTLPSGYTEVTSIIATPSPSPIPSPLYPGDNFTISTVVDPSNATDKEVIWSVQPAGIVGLSTNTGSSITVTGVAAGTATITATATGGVDITDTVLVTVTATPSSESEFEGTWKHSMDVLNAVFVITGNNWSFTSSAPEEYNVAPGPLAGTFTADDTSITFTATSGGSGSWTQPYTFETSWSNEEVMRLYSSTSGNMLTRLLGQFIKQ